MAKAAKKNRTVKDKVLKLDTSFDELVAMSVQGNPKPNPKKTAKKNPAK